MLALLIAMVIVVPIYAPYDVVRTWADIKAWEENPTAAAPAWTDYFTSSRLPPTLIAREGDFRKGGAWSDIFGIGLLSLEVRFNFNFDDFPSELTMWVYATYANVSPIITVELERPDGEFVQLMSKAAERQGANKYPYSKTALMPQTLKNIRTWAMTQHNATDVAHPKPEVSLFAVAGEDMLDPNRARVLRGEYKVRAEILSFGAEDVVDGKFVIFGKIFGVAGTDNLRRDLLTGLLWGAPIALVFGVVAALVIVMVQTIFGAISAWYGGRVDELIQRAADFNLVLPLLPILIIISLFYTPGIWWILGVLILFGIVGSTTKVIRSLVLQVREEQFIESALSYGASRPRVLFKHIIPRVMPYTFALIALSVPAYIFLEASLSFLGLGDPVLPTWGSLMGSASRANAMFNGFWWWISLPAAAIVFTTVAFALLGYSFDKVLNPRLREQ